MARGIDVSTEGLVVPSSVSGAIDVLLDGQRVWSFNPDRDGRPGRGRERSVAWPKALVRHLDGRRRRRARRPREPRRAAHPDGAVRERRPGGSASSTPTGNPLAVDKGGRLQRDFSNTEDSARDEIMDALEQVLHDLTERVRAGRLPDVRLPARRGPRRPHDRARLRRRRRLPAASTHHPFDIIRECTAATRRMRALGWKVVRMSGANFKVWVPLPDGRRCGIDVFGSFHIGERFYVTGSLTGTLDRSALLPFGTVTLEGREIVAPARPEEVLAFTYGPQWRVPDPAFHFDHDPVDVRRMDAWFRSSAAPAALLARLLQEPGRRPGAHRAVAVRRAGSSSGWRTAGRSTAPPARRRRRHRSRRGVLRRAGPSR